MGYWLRRAFGPFGAKRSESAVGGSPVGKGGTKEARGIFVQVGHQGSDYRPPGDDPRLPIGSPGVIQPQHDRNGRATATGERGVVQPSHVTRPRGYSGQEILFWINRRARQPGIAPPIAVGTVVFALLAYQLAELAPVIVLLVGLALVWMAHQRDKLRRTTLLFYELGEQAANRFVAIREACGNLARSERIWCIEARHRNWDEKRKGGARSLIRRRRATVGRVIPPFIVTNVDVWGIDVDTLKLLFFPDRMYVLKSGTYIALSYSSLHVAFEDTRFVEEERVPRDAEIIDHTWRYVRGNGGSEVRFPNNRRTPVVLYGLLEISSASGFRFFLHASNRHLAAQFAESFGSAQSRFLLAGTPQSSTTEGWDGARHDEKVAAAKSAYAILGVAEGTSPDELARVYHGLARMYHPDKVAGLAPEFRVLAENRMKEINAAYEQLKRRAK